MTNETENEAILIQPTKIHKCIKSLNIPDARISRDAVEFFTDYVNCVIAELAKEAFEYCKISKRHTIQKSDVAMAIPRYKVEGFELEDEEE